MQGNDRDRLTIIVNFTGTRSDCHGISIVFGPVIPIFLYLSITLMDKYKNKNRKSPRAQWWDYAWDGSYFITICTRNREHFFGDVRDAKMKLSAAGIIADVCWREIIEHAKNIELGPHVVMPNHVHGILTLKGNAAPFRYVQPTELAMDNVPDYDPDLLPMTVGRMRFQNPARNSISTIIGGYKAAVSKEPETREYISAGNHVFMITSFGTRKNISA